MFVWKKENQNKYYNILINNYVYKLFKYIKDTKQLFYLKYEKEKDFDNIINYYNSDNMPNLGNFQRNKEFINFKEFPVNEYNNTYDVDEENIGFSITKVDNIMDIDCNMGGCGQCNMQYGKGIWFEGYAYNTGLQEGAVKYEGYIKTYDLFRCNCSKSINTKEKECNEYDDVPCVVIDCSIPGMNLTLLRHCILFNIYFTDLPL